jgi:hypothetical protein
MFTNPFTAQATINNVMKTMRVVYKRTDSALIDHRDLCIVP